MGQIALSQGGIALVDDTDFEWLNDWTWRRDDHGYASTTIMSKSIRMHRLVMDFPVSITDHINRDRLDNRRSNLRTVTAQESSLNRNLFKNNASGHKGVHKFRNKWMAQLRRNGQAIYLGLYTTKEEAVRAVAQWS